MRSLLLAVTLMAPLAACAPRAHALAWPQRADRELDGGESIAPRQARAVATVVTDDADDEDVKPAAAPAKDTAAAVSIEPAKPVVPASPAAADDSLFDDDDITIEIED